MGGNLFSQAIRVDSNTYIKECAECRNYLLEKYNLETFEIPYYRNKKTFGDIDLIVTKDKFKPVQDDLITPHHSEFLYSFLWKGFIQVDLIYSPPYLVDSKLHYFAYNDLHNLIGKVSKSIRCKLSDTGLYFSFNNPWSGAIKEIFLTRNWREIYEFLGYDYEKYSQGFDDLSDIFDFVITSPYFQAGKFDLSNLKHRDRVRDRKRITYSTFLEYIQTNKLPTQIKYRSYQECINKVEDCFPHIYISKSILSSVFKECDNHYYRQKFNGDIVRNLIPLEGKELGKFIQMFKQRYSKEYLLTLGHLSINQLITEFYDQVYQSTSNVLDK